MFTRTNLGMLLAVLLSAGSVFGQRSAEEFRAPTLDLDMLVFDDQAHYAETRAVLMAQQEAADEESSGEDDRRASVFQDFANSLGFESLLVLIDKVEDSEETKDYYRSGVILDPTEPSNHYIPDSATRGLLNPQGEIKIGETIYRYVPHGYYAIENSDLDTLNRLRRGETEFTTPNLSFVGYESALTGSCCLKAAQKTKYQEFAEGQRRIKATQYVRNDSTGTTVGTETENQRKKNNGNWVRNKADRIEHSGGTWLGYESCDPDEYWSVYHLNFDDKLIQSGKWFPGENRPVVETFRVTHSVNDLETSGALDLNLCDCVSAQAAFTVPSSVTSSSSITLDGSSSSGETRYYIEVHQQGTSFYQSRWFGGQVGTVDLSDYFLLSDPGGNGTTFIVKLAVQNDCTIWDEQTREITVFGENTEVTYRAHMKNLGWGLWSWNGETAGTSGQERRIEAAEIKLANEPLGMGICYAAHVKGTGWPDEEVCNGETAGTTGQSRRMEAIRIRLTQAPAGCSIKYRVLVRDDGWSEFVYDGETAGTTGQGKRIEALQVLLEDCP